MVKLATYIVATIIVIWAACVVAVAMAGLV
jgi:hypothetical protein